MAQHTYAVIYVILVAQLLKKKWKEENLAHTFWMMQRTTSNWKPHILLSINSQTFRDSEPKREQKTNESINHGCFFQNSVLQWWMQTFQIPFGRKKQTKEYLFQGQWTVRSVTRSHCNMSLSCVQCTYHSSHCWKMKRAKQNTYACAFYVG